MCLIPRRFREKLKDSRGSVLRVDSIHRAGRYGLEL